ncbi:MAG: glycogen debranching enzyme, partial [Cyclobacteriaceae bacterium]
RTQKGNNNGYCQDNELSWFDWDLVEKNIDLLEFVQQLIKFNQSQRIFRMERFWSEKPERGNECITWHGVKLFEPDWSYYSHALAYQLKEEFGDYQYQFMINAWTEPLSFEVPETDYEWHTVINTNLEPSYYAYGKIPFNKHQYTVNKKSIVVLMSRLY